MRSPHIVANRGMLVFCAFGQAAVSRVTRGTIEAQVANAVVQFQREQHGRGPSDVRVTVVGDLVLVRCAGIFTATETRLLSTEEGRRLIKSARSELRSIVRADVEELVGRLTGCQVMRSYGDLDVAASEQMEVFVLDTDLEKRLLRQELDALSGLGSRQGQENTKL